MIRTTLLQIGAAFIALALSASAASAQAKYRADDGTFIHVDYDVHWFTFTDSEEIGDFEGAAEFSGELVDCEDRAYQCIAMEGWVFAIPRDRSQLSWTVSGSDFQRINCAAVSEIIDVRVSSGGEEYSSFSFDPERGIIHFQFGRYGDDDYRQFRLYKGDGLLNP